MIEDLFGNHLINEILDSKFDMHRDHATEELINNHLKNKIHSAHTAVMYSDHMHDHGHSVIKLMNKNKEVEYHFNTSGKYEEHKLDLKSMLHSMKIIHDDAQKHLNKGHKIKLQSDTPEQHKIYAKFGNRLIKNHKNLKVRDAGSTKKLDGTGKGLTHIIEGNHDGAVNWSDFIRRIRETSLNDNIK